MNDLKRPGINKNDPQTMRYAKAVATRKNNAFKKNVRARIPLFEKELMAEFEPLTAVNYIDRRIEFQEDHRQWRKEFHLLERRQIRDCRQKIRELIGNDKEFLKIIRAVVRLRGGGRFARWYRMLDLWRRRGDGVSPEEILKALCQLMNLKPPVWVYRTFPPVRPSCSGAES